MAKTPKTKDIELVVESGTFTSFFRKITGDHKEHDFEDITTLRRLLSNEKARILHAIKTKKPSSMYGLAKLLKRDFKSVNDDVKLLKKFGFVELISEKTGKRARLKPVLAVDSLQINVKI
jgi:predicted transcriptional regulator